MYSLVQLIKKFPVDDEDGEIPLPAETPEGYTTLRQTMVNNLVLNIREWTLCVLTVNPRFHKPTGIPYRNKLNKTKLLTECFSVTLDTTSIYIHLKSQLIHKNVVNKHAKWSKKLWAISLNTTS